MLKTAALIEYMLWDFVSAWLPLSIQSAPLGGENNAPS